MQQDLLNPRTVAILRRVAGEYADSYVSEFLAPHLFEATGAESEDANDIRNAFAGAYRCLLAFYGHYAFARRGKDRDILSDISRQALERVSEGKPFDRVLAQADGTALWQAFDALCVERRHKSNEPQNRGLIQGMLELAQEIYRLDNVGSIAGWMLQGISKTGRLEPQFLRIVDIRGVGPKSTSTFMRDVAYYFGVEDRIEPADRIYVQPIDRWMRLMATLVVPEPGMDKAADWIIAGKVAKYARRARVSGIRFNMGTTFYGQRVVKDPELLEEALDALAGSAPGE